MSNTNATHTVDFDSSKLSFEEFRDLIISDYRLAVESRQVSLLGRKEVLTGKAKFGIFGDGKELAQIALSKAFRNGDWRSGYYRDQTMAMALGFTDIYQFFSQLYATPDLAIEPASGGRQMNCHFSTQLLDADGQWLNQTQQKNSASDISTTGGQMARAVGLGLASTYYRDNEALRYLKYFSDNGNEVVFCNIGNASTSEGVFWETINAIGVKQLPLVVSIWDDGYGISVPNDVQTTKSDISQILKGFQTDEHGVGFEIFKVCGWDYPGLCEVYKKAADLAREKHRPCIVHVCEMTQPQGHSTSGSHERYKTGDRLKWEEEYDCNLKMRHWMLESGIADEETLVSIERESKEKVRAEQRRAWTDYQQLLQVDFDQAVALLSNIDDERVEMPLKTLQSLTEYALHEIYGNVRRALRDLRGDAVTGKEALLDWYNQQQKINQDRYNDFLFSNTIHSPSLIENIQPEYDVESPVVDGREILNACFREHFAKDDRLIAFGEDVGKIGDVNQGFAGLQEQFGEARIFDTGIRESTIIGKGIGLAMRGLRPIAEIQYLDYLIYALPVLSDDLASLSYRTKGRQKAPLIIRTRGHRLEGVWHSGSPMSVLLGALRGIHLCVPRNMTQAAGMYNMLLKSDEPALVVECLNGYRLKEKMPQNVSDFTVPLGVAEIVREGQDITVVSYGSTLRVVQEAALELEKLGISLEIVDAQYLMPFDREKICATSLQKTNKLLVVDEDFPGGASAYLLSQILEDQQGYYLLDSQPRTLTAKAHRPPYGSDGDYFTKPSVDDVIETVYAMISETNPQKYPAIY
ncbi:alpha-ketoacid dehydrogenase subunit alpha/beta [Sphingobacterium corticibacter]|uniref:3-methyl-2-oxobutanoate dehydrogenase (2-methylpropanoyl-transferring) n=1 Tax=Sphingobacterium corticibacter TaxID=2171749 RepID=A0A2T8HM85_9SPHI|nr:alpha-ketoacid dehydrogenase subunit alpha/beta [Sphingobacterium corticibacter]PVH26537.1 transketolase [Sphingobacterium corticibacter]